MLIRHMTTTSFAMEEYYTSDFSTSSPFQSICLTVSPTIISLCLYARCLWRLCLYCNHIHTHLTDPVLLSEFMVICWFAKPFVTELWYLCSCSIDLHDLGFSIQVYSDLQIFGGIMLNLLSIKSIQRHCSRQHFQYNRMRI